MWTWLKRVLQSEHQWATQQLSAYLDGELSPSDRARVEAHLRECQLCAEELKTLRWTARLTAQMPMLKAPRSFLITEAVAQPRRARLNVAYGYLRSASIAAAALLLIVVMGDLLTPYVLPSQVSSPPGMVRKISPATNKVPPEMRVEAERLAEKPTPPWALMPTEETVAEGPPMVTQASATPALEEMALQAAQAAPKVEREPTGALAPPATREPPKEVGAPEAKAMGAERPAVAEKKTEALMLPSPTPPRLALVPTPIASPPARVAKAVPSPPPVPPPVEAPETCPVPFWHPALRVVEIGLAALTALLVGSTLIVRARRK